ncbi:hypothetical protein GCM10010348_27510 [Streptomyces anthocyanicus]|nr:hypothetical protein GCM10010348_27510 [Streptomyces anthocyanicus]
MAEAKALYEAGRYAEAEVEARAVSRSRPRDDAYGAVALNIAAIATGAQGRHTEALATYDEALPVFGRIFGADHWLTRLYGRTSPHGGGRPRSTLWPAAARQGLGLRGGVGRTEVRVHRAEVLD